MGLMAENGKFQPSGTIVAVYFHGKELYILKLEAINV